MFASLEGDWRKVWEPKILEVDEKEKESSMALQSKLEGIFLQVRQVISLVTSHPYIPFYRYIIPILHFISIENIHFCHCLLVVQWWLLYTSILRFRYMSLVGS